MPLLTIDATQIRDWPTFHSVFASAFGFPSFYGRNMNAWIDCMTSLDADDGMTTVHATPADPLVLQLDNADALPGEIFDALARCTAFVNWRRLETGQPAILILSCNRSG